MGPLKRMCPRRSGWSIKVRVERMSRSFVTRRRTASYRAVLLWLWLWLWLLLLLLLLYIKRLELSMEILHLKKSG
jgi:hypothetical protein